MPLAYLCRILQTIIFSAKFDQLPLKALKKKKKKCSYCFHTATKRQNSPQAKFLWLFCLFSDLCEWEHIFTPFI